MPIFRPNWSRCRITTCRSSGVSWRPQKTNSPVNSSGSGWLRRTSRYQMLWNILSLAFAVKQIKLQLDSTESSGLFCPAIRDERKSFITLAFTGNGSLQEDIYGKVVEETSVEERARASMESSEGTGNHPQKFGVRLNLLFSQCKLRNCRVRIFFKLYPECPVLDNFCGLLVIFYLVFLLFWEKMFVITFLFVIFMKTVKVGLHIPLCFR